MAKPKGTSSFRISDKTQATMDRLLADWGLSKGTQLELGIELLDRLFRDAPKAMVKAMAEEAKTRGG